MKLAIVKSSFNAATGIAHKLNHELSKLRSD